jgi:hypothetical protein
MIFWESLKLNATTTVFTVGLFFTVLGLACYLEYVAPVLIFVVLYSYVQSKLLPRRM